MRTTWFSDTTPLEFANLSTLENLKRTPTIESRGMSRSESTEGNLCLGVKSRSPILAAALLVFFVFECFGQTNLIVTSAGFLNGRFKFTVLGPIDHICVIQSSTNLIDWIAASTNAFAGGRVEFQEIESPAPRCRFYRAWDACCPESSQSITLVSNDKGQTVHVKIGMAIDVILTANPSTGYIWEIANVNSSVVRQTADPTFKADRPVPGSPGKMTFHFQAIGKGESNLKLIYHRPFEATQPPIDTFDVTIVVD